MKNITKILFFAIVLTSLISCKKDDPDDQDQVTGPAFTIQVDGEDLLNNDSRTYLGIGEQDGNMDLRITNKLSSTISLVIEVVSISGTSGALTQLCLGECYDSIIEGTVYPYNFDLQEILPYELGAGETTLENFAHIQNNDDRSGDLEFVFKVYQVNTNGTELSGGTSLEFKYLYDSQ